MKIFSLLEVLLALISVASAGLNPLVIKGSKLFYTNGTQFFIKGKGEMKMRTRPAYYENGSSITRLQTCFPCYFNRLYQSQFGCQSHDGLTILRK
jgi:hypothetical protein